MTRMPLIEFSEEDLDKIVDYTERNGFDTLQEAIMNAIEKGE